MTPADGSAGNMNDMAKTGDNINVQQSQNNVPSHMQNALDSSAHLYTQPHKVPENANPNNAINNASTQQQQPFSTTQSNQNQYQNQLQNQLQNQQQNQLQNQQQNKQQTQDEKGSDPDALTKLLEHIESLKQTNAEMSATLENIKEKNMENYHIEVEEKIKPWVSSLNIPPEQKESFLMGIQVACEQGMKKRGIVDFKSNPAFSIACAAAQAHGTLIENAEKIRVEFLEANKRIEMVKEEESTNYNNNRQRQHAILSSALTTNSHDRQQESAPGQKRRIDEVYNTKSSDMPTDTVSSCWDTVFNAMEAGNR